LCILGVGSLSVVAKPAPPALQAMFVQDGLAIFAKRLFLAATFIGFLAGISRDGVACGRRAGEYHLLILSSLPGMLCFSWAPDLLFWFFSFGRSSFPLSVSRGCLR